MGDLRTSPVAKVGAAVRHVEVDRAGAVFVAEDVCQRLQHKLRAGVGHHLSPVRQPASAAAQHLLKVDNIKDNIPEASQLKSTMMSECSCSLERKTWGNAWNYGALLPEGSRMYGT